MSPKVYQFVFRSQCDGQLEHIFDSSPMVPQMEYDALAAELKMTEQALANRERNHADTIARCDTAEARICALEALLRESQERISKDWIARRDALIGTTAETSSPELKQAPMPCPGFDSGACVLGGYCGGRDGYAYPCPGQRYPGE